MNSKSSLKRVLKNREWEQFNQAHFERAIQAVHPVDLAPKGPMKTLLEKIELILSINCNKVSCFQNEQELKKLYASYLYQTKGWSGRPLKSIKDPINRVKKRLKMSLVHFFSPKPHID
ncbi:MAG: hypothetical protein OMM_08009 [Candidatus Magnetoglobus multicellularis str. Araruama]|uniref:Uncharacterized protein n=1 Tax=Candidatus Magnetoglobus multicellularis str. Araruama TaxID=890399 RepID=A0A1V1P9V1_9BACT|nr:MAG: hypothetical protein OMM_08009 [Candidatus Magnetoglobus multicellularis str. Araruama]